MRIFIRVTDTISATTSRTATVRNITRHHIDVDIIDGKDVSIARDIDPSLEIFNQGEARDWIATIDIFTNLYNDELNPAEVLAMGNRRIHHDLRQTDGTIAGVDDEVDIPFRVLTPHQEKCRGLDTG